MLDFLHVKDVNSKAFSAAMEIYCGAFPLNEQQPLHVIKERVEKGLSELYIGHADKEIVFMALLWPLKDTDFILLDYMATLHSHRGKSAGSYFLQHITQLLKENNKYFILEAESPAFGNNKEERERRVAFYKRNGAKLLKDVRYVLPGMHGLEPTEMVLLMLPEYKNGNIGGTLVRKLVTQVYGELYNRHAGDDLLETSLQSIKDSVQLI
jgi:GNAT superfamily N-acetyltransferase